MRSFLPARIGVRGDEADDRAVCLERGLTPTLPAFVSLRQTQAPPVLDHTGALPQRDRRVGPALDRCSVGRHRQGVLLDAGPVIDDGLAVRSVHVSMRASASSPSSSSPPLPAQSSSATHSCPLLGKPDIEPTWPNDRVLQTSRSWVIATSPCPNPPRLRAYCPELPKGLSPFSPALASQAACAVR